MSVDDTVGSGRSRTAARMPNGGALQVHLLPVAERVTAFRATRARRMEMMIVTGLQDLAADVAIAVSTLHPELLLVVLLAVRHAVPIAKKKKKKKVRATGTECECICISFHDEIKWTRSLRENRSRNEERARLSIICAKDIYFLETLILRVFFSLHVCLSHATRKEILYP